MRCSNLPQTPPASEAPTRRPSRRSNSSSRSLHPTLRRVMPSLKQVAAMEVLLLQLLQAVVAEEEVARDAAAAARRRRWKNRAMMQEKTGLLLDYQLLPHRGRSWQSRCRHQVGHHHYHRQQSHRRPLSRRSRLRWFRKRFLILFQRCLRNHRRPPLLRSKKARSPLCLEAEALRTRCAHSSRSPRVGLLPLHKSHYCQRLRRETTWHGVNHHLPNIAA
mmetsp:Transcript_62722/g.149635  ORF Transcript_62722/g.149635 Transcript_62722/m.149635 type:complete len:219 (-) Transcript_62722:70-726(-)